MVCWRSHGVTCYFCTLAVVVLELAVAGLEAARSSVFEIFSAAVCVCSSVGSSAVRTAAWPWLRCVATAAPTPRPCVHLSPLSSVQPSTPSLHRGLPQHNTWRLAGPLYAPWPHLSTVSSGRVLANLYRKLIAGQHCHHQGAEVIHRSNCCCC